MLSSKDLFKLLKAGGWYQVRGKGAPCQFRHDKIEGLVTIPDSERNMPKGTMKIILKQTGVTS